MTSFSVTVRELSTGPLLEFAGELDVHTAAEVRAALHEISLAAGQQLVADLSGLTFCDSSGISTFIAARNRALSVDAGIALAAVPERIARTFRLIGLSDLFPTYPSVHEAAAAWDGRATGS